TLGGVAAVALSLLAVACGGSSPDSAPLATTTVSPAAPATIAVTGGASPISPLCRVVTYTPPGRRPWQADLCVPEANPSRTAIVIAHGAGAVATMQSTRVNVAVWARYYVEHGLLALNIDFTPAEPPGPTYPEPIVDEKTAVQFLRLHAAELGR